MDFVQECFLTLFTVGEKADVRIVAKETVRTFFSKYRGGYKGLDIVKEQTINSMSKTEAHSFSDLLDLGIPNNKNDLLAIRPYCVIIENKKYFFDKHDLSELLKINILSVQASRNRGKDIILFVYENKIYSSIKDISKYLKIRQSKAKELAKRVVLKWA